MTVIGKVQKVRFVKASQGWCKPDTKAFWKITLESPSERYIPLAMDGLFTLRIT